MVEDILRDAFDGPNPYRVSVRTTAPYPPRFRGPGYFPIKGFPGYLAVFGPDGAVRIEIDLSDEYSYYVRVGEFLEFNLG